MSSKITSSSSDQYQTQIEKQVEPDKNIQNIPNRRSIKDSAKVKPANKSASAFRTISEVANELGVQQHVLRFWETKFSHIKPMKRGGGRRYYRPEDLELLKNIHHLLYNEGYTIKGVQKLLKTTRGNLSARVSTADAAPVEIAQTEAPVSGISKVVKENKAELKSMLDELKDLRKLID